MWHQVTLDQCLGHLNETGNAKTDEAGLNKGKHLVEPSVSTSLPTAVTQHSPLLLYTRGLALTGSFLK